MIAEIKTAINPFFMRKEIDISYSQDHQTFKTNNYPFKKNFEKNLNKL